MPATWLRDSDSPQADRLFVFLPGRRDMPADFVENGFIEILRNSGMSADAVLVDAHLGYYYRRTFTNRLEADIMAVAREKGYREIWAVGVSLGGLGAVLYERDRPGAWSGIVLLAPFPGDQKEVLNRVLSAASIEEIEFSEPLSEDEYTARFWSWLQAYKENPGFPILLAYGEQDRMEKEQSAIARVLPEEWVFTQPGGHDWKAWRRLWKTLMPVLKAETRDAEATTGDVRSN